jgi:hypothetical protein
MILILDELAGLHERFTRACNSYQNIMASYAAANQPQLPSNF